MHWNSLSGTYLRLEACQIKYHRFWVSVISGSSKSHNIRLHFNILLILTGQNALKLHEWCICRVWGMPNPMALVASPYDKWFMKNHNFRRHIAANGVQIHEMEWDICNSPSWVTFYPYTMFQNSISWPSHNKCRKTIIIQKVLVTQSCNIVHCNWHTKNPICAYLQVFVNTLSLWILMVFSVFCQGEFRK